MKVISSRIIQLKKSIAVAQAFQLAIGDIGHGYISDTIDVEIISPIKAPKIAPDQGFAVIAQALPAHLPRYPITPPITAPATAPMTYLIIVVATSLYSFASSWLPFQIIGHPGCHKRSYPGQHWRHDTGHNLREHLRKHRFHSWWHVRNSFLH